MSFLLTLTILRSVPTTSRMAHRTAVSCFLKSVTVWVGCRGLPLRFPLASINFITSEKYYRVRRRCIASSHYCMPLGPFFQGRLLDNQEGANAERYVVGFESTLLHLHRHTFPDYRYSFTWKVLGEIFTAPNFLAPTLIQLFQLLILILRRYPPWVCDSMS